MISKNKTGKVNDYYQTPLTKNTTAKPYGRKSYSQHRMSPMKAKRYNPIHDSFKSSFSRSK
jgi:hypothetical protein